MSSRVAEARPWWRRALRGVVRIALALLVIAFLVRLRQAARIAVA